MFIVTDLVSLSGLKVYKPFGNQISVGVPSESDELLNDTPNSSPSPLVEMVISWVCHFSVVTP